MQKRIVIADDDPTMRAALGEVLQSAGYSATLFASGEEAERYLKENTADLVVSDVRMPGLGGLELLRRFQHISFIMISGFATVPEAVEAMKAFSKGRRLEGISIREVSEEGRKY